MVGERHGRGMGTHAMCESVLNRLVLILRKQMSDCRVDKITKLSYFISLFTSSKPNCIREVTGALLRI